ncbi:MAG TPA: DnaJ family domain-containing protein [Anaerolineales bacterium]|nr:DnaJ family domain-containing protein [Anaerolineales bacterium]
MFWRKLADRRWEEAQASGALDDLPGRGEPLSLEDDSAVPEEWRTAFHLLRNSEHAPAWIETAREARQRVETACEDLRRAMAGGATPQGDESRRARQRFEAEIGLANDLIDSANRLVPHPSLRWSRWNPDRLAQGIAGPRTT